MSAPGHVLSWLGTFRAQVDAALPGMLPERHELAAAVHDAMAAMLLSEGKRIRPALMLAVGKMYRVDPERLLPAAGAIEMVHTASLILDDLPSMDDARLRRGEPACHIKFGEATAILAAVALLNRAFGILAGVLPDDATRDRLRGVAGRSLSDALGPDGLIGGQQADLDVRGDGAVDLARMEFIHSHKTGSLFIAAVEIGARLSGATPEETGALVNYARNLGLAFQITDDLIDAVGDEATAGKTVRADAGKSTFVSLCGIDGSRTLAAELAGSAAASLELFGQRARQLRELARYVAARDR